MCSRRETVSGCYGDSAMSILGVISPLLVYARDLGNSLGSSVLYVMVC